MADELHIYEDISDYKYCVSEKINVKKLKKSVKYIQRIDKKAKRKRKSIRHYIRNILGFQSQRAQIFCGVSNILPMQRYCIQFKKKTTNAKSKDWT